jgi:hypothetical protein
MFPLLVIVGSARKGLFIAGVEIETRQKDGQEVFEATSLWHIFFFFLVFPFYGPRVPPLLVLSSVFPLMGVGAAYSTSVYARS